MAMRKSHVTKRGDLGQLATSDTLNSVYAQNPGSESWWSNALIVENPGACTVGRRRSRFNEGSMASSDAGCLAGLHARENSGNRDK
jgi:hypothetical protein